MDKARAFVIIAKNGTGPAEMGRLGQAEPTIMVVTTPGKLAPATVAERRLNQPDPKQAIGAEMNWGEGWQSLPAKQADRRETELAE